MSSKLKSGDKSEHLADVGGDMISVHVVNAKRFESSEHRANKCALTVLLHVGYWAKRANLCTDTVTGTIAIK